MELAIHHQNSFQKMTLDLNLNGQRLFGSELTLTEFAKLVAENKVRLTYEGSDANETTKLLKAWRKKLIVSKPPTFHKHVTGTLPWKFEAFGKFDDISYYRMSNSMTGQSVDFGITMNKVL